MRRRSPKRPEAGNDRHQSRDPASCVIRTIISTRVKGRRMAGQAIKGLDKDTIAMLDEYAATVEKTFGDQFKAAGGRLIGGDKLLARFTEAMAAVKEHGRGKFTGVDEAHNELCVASALLAAKKTVFEAVEYEPALPNTKETIDFVCKIASGNSFYVDAKTIHPALTDRWDQFEKVKAEGKIPRNVDVVLSKQWLGGEIWHSMFAARSRMLEYAMEFERKIRDAELAAPGNHSTIVFGGAGFHWHEDELEEFVAFYRTGVHLPGDAFAEMEAWYVKEKDIKFDRTIGAFASMRRYQFDIQQTRLNWNVQPPEGGDDFGS